LSQIVLISAVARNGVIGSDNEMPWRLPTDLKRFKKMTVGKPVVMGRKTFLSFGGKPLPGRPHIVISRDSEYAPADAEAATSLEAALERAETLAQELGVDEIICMGGGQIYAQAMPLADRLEITEVSAEPIGDTCFPEIDPREWVETSREQGVRTDLDSADIVFVTYNRKPQD
jgi:dihydrofolate reductase